MRPRLKWLTENWRLKVFSLVVSILLFTFVSVEYSTVVGVEYPIDYRTADDIMITTTDRPSTLKVTLKGPWATFRSFSDLPPVIIDLSGEAPSPLPLRKTIQSEWIKSPAGMSVVALQPSQVEITLDRKVEKAVAVEPDYDGRPAFGFDIDEVVIAPPRVRVVGPLSEIRTLDFVHTKPVKLADRSEDLTVEAELKRPSALVRYIDRATVTVTVSITEVTTNRAFELPVRIENAPEGTEKNPDLVKIEIKGPRHLVDRLAKDAFGAVIDASAQVAEGKLTFEKPITIKPDLPERTKLVGETPKVTVTLPGGRRN